MTQPPYWNDPNPQTSGQGPHRWEDERFYPGHNLPFPQGPEVDANQARMFGEFQEMKQRAWESEQSYMRQLDRLYRVNGISHARRKSSPVSYRPTTYYSPSGSDSAAAPIVVEYCETSILHHRAVHPKPMNNFMIIAAVLFAVELAIAIWQWPMEQWTNNHGLLAGILGVGYFVIFMVGGFIAVALTFVGERRINRTRAMHTATCKKAFL